MTLPIADGPVPKHEQLRSLLESRIAAEFSPGDPLPGERALEDEYGVSRITVNRALQSLRARGLIAVRPGVVRVLDRAGLARRAGL